MIPYWREPAFELLGFTLHGWGLMVSTGILVGFVLARRRARALGLDPRAVLGLGISVVVTGFLTAHVVDVVFYSQQLFAERTVTPRHFEWRELYRVWHGYSSFGGFLGAVIAALVYRRATRLRLSEYVDPVLWGFVPGWMLGRIGCFLAHDHPGARSDFFLAVRFPSGTRHDLGLYEALLAAFLGLAMVALDRRGLRRVAPGVVIAAYAIARFGFEMLRWRDARYLGLTPAQYGAIPLLVLGLVMTVRAARSSVEPAHG